MLVELNVKNFALIEKLQLTLGSGLNVLTGETGAGKSIIVGAINLILGGRAAGDLIRKGADEAEVAALFLPEDPAGLTRRLLETGLDLGREIIIRRVLSRTGRNRIYINGSLATLTQLTILGRELVAVSGQHEHQQLLDRDRQLLFLDQFGGLISDRAAMEQAFGRWTELAADRDRLKGRIVQIREKSDLFEFQVREINEALLQAGEDEDLEKERRRLKGAEKIYTLLRLSYERLYNDSGAAIELLDAIRSDVSQAADLDEELLPTADQIEEAYHQLDDAAAGLRLHLDRVRFDPERLSEVEDRLDMINRLKRKYGATLEDVLNYGRQTSSHLDDLADLESRLAGMEVEVEQSISEACRLAENLSADRRRTAAVMSSAVTAELRSLGMPHLRFDLAFEFSSEKNRPGPTGWDEVEYLIAPNLGEDLLPLARIVSGGEMSRTMLGLKSLLAGQEKVQTIIFDEVDAGIGGAVAEVVGRKIKQLSSFHQLLCITHLPQIAAFGQQHHLVYKEVRGRRTVTGIRQLSSEEKEVEIARMLAGAEPTDSALAAAREMIKRSC